jgi:hypothetical protein
MNTNGVRMSSASTMPLNARNARCAPVSADAGKSGI